MLGVRGDQFFQFFIFLKFLLLLPAYADLLPEADIEACLDIILEQPDVGTMPNDLASSVFTRLIDYRRVRGKDHARRSFVYRGSNACVVVMHLPEGLRTNRGVLSIHRDGYIGIGRAGRHLHREMGYVMMGRSRNEHLPSAERTPEALGALRLNPAFVCSHLCGRSRCVRPNHIAVQTRSADSLDREHHNKKGPNLVGRSRFREDSDTP